MQEQRQTVLNKILGSKREQLTGDWSGGA